MRKLLYSVVCLAMVATTFISASGVAVAQGPVPQANGAGNGTGAGAAGGMGAVDMRKDMVTNEMRQAAGNAARVARAQAKANASASSSTAKPNATVQAALAPTPGGVPDYFGITGNFANSPLPAIDANGNVIAGSGMRKFVDSLPGLGPAGSNDLGQYVSVANADTITYPGSDYYEVAAVEFTEQMHADLPPTTLRGYVQLNNGTSANGTNTVAPSPVHYLGPAIVATADRPVRIKFTNLLPITSSPMDLFLPMDTTMMGAGAGPNGGAEMNPDNRAVIHLHGGLTPWTSDGTPYQWITPNLESTVPGRTYLKGASVQDVPDMPVSPGGSVTLYYTNQQTARLMFYHDHAEGITRLNVYDGLAAPYILTDDVEKALVSGGTATGPYGSITVPAGGVVPSDQIPLVIQDKTFVPDNTRPYSNVNGDFASQLAAQDPTWNATTWGGVGNLWYPHVYMPNQNPFDPAGVTAMGRWDYGPWFGAVGTLNGPVSNVYYDPVNAPWEPPQMPGVPDVSVVAETFFDTPVVNGTAYPTLTVQPKAYRFRVLSAGDDRFWNLSLFQAAPLTISVTAPGSGYASPPTVNINSGSVAGATATASLGIVGLTVTAGGTGYTSVPNVTINAPTGSGATAAAIMTGASVSSILVMSQGAGYTTPVTVTFSGGGGSGASASAVLGVTQVNIVNRGTASSGAIVNPTITFTGGGGTGASAVSSVLTDVSMVPAVPNQAIPFPAEWVIPTDLNVVTSDILDGRIGGVPDPRFMGPSWIQIGNEGGFLPQVVEMPPMPIGYQHNNKNATWNGVTKKSLYLAPAERADVIVDFSAYAGKTLMLYNDAPAPAPLFDVRNDYYTGGPDQSAFGGAPSTLAGYGPNTRTIMQIRVAAAAPAPAVNVTALNTAIMAAYNASQDRPLVPASAYNSALGTTYPDDYVRVLDTEFSPAASPQGVASVVVNFKGTGFLTSVPSVILSGGGGSGATATAFMLDQGQVDAFVIGNPGSGYTSAPTVTLSAPTGAGGIQATAEAEIQSGQLVAVDVTNPGAGYIVPPTVTISGGGGSGAQAACDIGTAFTITAMGTGYNSANTTVTLTPLPTGSGGTNPTATPYLGISSVTVVTAGTYPSYTSPPTITVTGGGGSGALLVPVMSLNPIPGQLGGGTSVAGVTVLSPGGGYTSIPTVTFSGGGAGSVQATATAVLGVAGINVSFPNPGSGYIQPPTVTITDSSAVPGTGATAIAVNTRLTTGFLGRVTVNTPGSGYTTAPIVTFVGGGGAANTATAYATLTNTIAYSLQNKDLVPVFERYYGRLSMLEGANLVGFYYIDPVTEVWRDSITAGPPVAGDGTQIWAINPGLGVDSHPLHFHLYNVQVINRVQIDGVINPPDPNELGWRETVRINPFELLIVAARPVAPKMPFNLPDSIRPLSPSEPLGATGSFSNLTPGGAVTSITNVMTNFGWEYVWHCHILSHEENDMMRPMSFLVTSTIPAVPTLSVSTVGGGATLTWNDATPPIPANMGNAANEVGFTITRNPAFPGGPIKVPANTTTYVDGAAANGDTYSIAAYNNAGTSASSNQVTANGVTARPATGTPALISPSSGAALLNTAPMPFSWAAVAGATSYNLQVLSGVTVVVNMPGLISDNTNLPNGLLAAGSYTWRVSATGPAGTSANSAANAFSVLAAPTLTSPASGVQIAAPITLTWGAVTGATYRLQVTATGAPTPAIDVSGIGTNSYTIAAGTLAVGTTYSWQVNVTASGVTSAFSTPFTFTVVPPLAITTASLPQGAAGTAYSATLAGSGGNGAYAWSTNTTLPAGLTLSAGGVLSGLPTAAFSGNVNIILADSANNTPANRALSLTINPPPPLSITTTSLPSGLRLAPYSQTLAATGGVPPYTWSTANGTLPAGLSLTAGTGVISGNPSLAGTSNFTARVTDNLSATATMALSITINTPPPLVVSTTTLAQGYVGAPYSHTLVATGGNGVYSWSTNSTLPTGLTLSAAGVLSGTPTVAATANITVIVADSAGTAPANNILSLTVVVPGPISITTTSLPAGTVGATYSASLVATGGTTAYTWTTTNGTLPGGLALAGNGIISGTPTTAGTFTFGANVTDTAHATLGSNFSITIAAYVPPPVYGGGGGGAPLTYAIALTGLSGSLNVNSSGVSSSGGQLTNGSGLILSAPAGATLLTAQGTYLTTITLASPGTSPPAAPAGKVIIATYQFGPDGATFNPALTLTVPYTPGSLPGGVKETDLVIARWNGTAWTILTTTVDAQAKTVSAPVTGFSYFALLAPQPAPTTAAPTPTSTPPPTTTAAPPTTTAPPPTTTAPPATSTPPSTQTPTSSTPSESTSSESNALLWVILAGSLVVVAVVVGILVSRRRRK